MHHILFFSPHSDPQASLGELDSGGQCVYEHELARALSTQPDFKVTTFCRQNYYRQDVSVVNNSYRIVRIACGEKKQLRKEDIEKVLPEFCTKVIEYIEGLPQEDTYIVHSHYWDGAYVNLGIKSLWKCKLPSIWTPHSLGSLKRRKTPGASNEWKFNFIPRQAWESYITHAADLVIVSTEDEKRNILSDYAAQEEKIRVIAPGVDVARLQEATLANTREKLGLPQEGRILLGIGRMVRNKGYHHSILAFAKLKERFPENVYLVICGGSAAPTDEDERAYREELQSLITQLGLNDSVILRPALAHDQIRDLYSSADIFLMSSEHEPFGLVTIEAMACGLPVIAEKSGGSVNILTHNKDGILTSFHDPERVASAIISLLKDDEFYSRISQAAMRHAKRDYDWVQKSEQFAQVYREISRSVELDEFQEHVRHNFFLQQHFTV